MLREKLNDALKQAMRDKETLRVSTLRLVMAAIKDRDIALRADGQDNSADDTEITTILIKMVKQRKDSATQYSDAGRKDLADKEHAEIAVIGMFLPKQLSDEQTQKAIETLIKELNVESIRDMGKIMGTLKERYSGQMDFAKAGALVKKILG